MSHLPDYQNLYTDHEEYKVQEGDCLTEICVYTLKDGGYLYVKTVYDVSTNEHDHFKDRKLKETTCYACMEKPELISDKEHKDKTLDAFTKLFNLAKTK